MTTQTTTLQERTVRKQDSLGDLKKTVGQRHFGSSAPNSQDWNKDWDKGWNKDGH